MDFVYILGEGSMANNLELFTSMSLLKKHCLDLGTIYVVGSEPGFSGDFIHLPAKDEYKHAWQNVFSKIHKAINELPLGDKFVLMNDDFFCNEDFFSKDIPYYAVKGGSGGINGIHSFEIHAPYIIEKELFKTMPISVFSPKETSIRSFYGNFFRCVPEFVKDTIIRRGEDFPSYDEQVEGKIWFSTDDKIFTYPDFLEWLKTKVGTDAQEPYIDFEVMIK